MKNCSYFLLGIDGGHFNHLINWKHLPLVFLKYFVGQQKENRKSHNYSLKLLTMLLATRDKSLELHPFFAKFLTLITIIENKVF